MRKSTEWSFRVGPLRFTRPASLIGVTLVALVVIIVCCCVPLSVGAGV